MWLVVGVHWTVLAFLLGCVPSPFYLFIYFLWYFHDSIWCWSNWPPKRVCITGDVWWPLVNPLSLLWCSQLVRTCCYPLPRAILFVGRSQWLCELLGSRCFVGLKVLPNYRPYLLWMADCNGYVIPLFQKIRRDKSLTMMIYYISYLVLDLSISLAVTVHYVHLRSWLVGIS